jgi:hypothetical protein
MRRHPFRHPFSRAVMPAVLLCVVLALGACGRGAAPGSAPAGAGDTAAAPSLPSLADDDTERTWAGLLPCSDCRGVDTRLVLRVHGARRDYLMTETYLAPDGGKRFSRAGAWDEARLVLDGGQTIVYQLDPERAGERFALQPDGALELLEANGTQPADALAYRLQRL